MALPELAFTPQGFYGFYSAFELFSFVVATAVAYYSYRIYKVSDEIRYSHFAFSFMLLAIALFIRGILDFQIYDLIRTFGVQQFLSEIASGSSVLHENGTHLYRLLTLAAYALLIKALFNIEDMKKSLIVLAAIFVGVIGSNYLTFLVFNLFSLALLIAIAKYFYANYSNHNSQNARLTLISFTLIALSELFFILIIVNNQFFLVAHLARLLGFLLLAYNMYLIFRK